MKEFKQISSVLLSNGDGNLVFFCKGCEAWHSLYIATDEGINREFEWKFNGDYEKPTFTPDVATVLPGRRGVYEENGTYDFGDVLLCHAEITDGKIKYYESTTHHLSGKTVDLASIDDEREART